MKNIERFREFLENGFRIYLEYEKATFEYYDNGCKIYNDWVTIEINVDRVY